MNKEIWVKEFESILVKKLCYFIERYECVKFVFFVMVMFGIGFVIGDGIFMFVILGGF